MIIEILLNFFMLMFLHALADFALQSDAMAKGKNRNKIPDYIPEGQKLTPCWFWWLSAHALISGGLIYLIFDSWLVGLIEVAAHFIIDFIKCENKTNPHQDQALHILCRIGYSILLVI